MRRPSPRTLFLAAMALALGLPLLGWFGLPGFVGAHGFDTPDVPPPPPTPENLVSGRFREGVSAHWGHVFFGRTELLFLKNGLFDLASGGRYHAGFAGRIVQGRDGWLFEKPYLDVSFRTNLPIARPRLRSRTLHSLERLRAALDAVRPGAPVAFVLAPSKAELLRDRVPARYFAFGERPASEDADPEPYRTVRGLLSDAGFPFVDASALADPAADPRTLFPYGGTHWTVDYAARAAAAALAHAAPALPRPAPLPPVFAPGPDDPRDRDIAGLLNLPVPYRRGGDLHARAVFPPVDAPGTNTVYLLGDSFGEQLQAALVRSGLYAETNVVLRFNELPPAREFRDAAAHADAILFVFSAPSLAGTRLAETAEALANDLRPVVRPGRRYALGRSPYAMDGDWREEDGGRALVLDPGAEGIVELPSGGWLRPESTLSLLDPDGAVALSVPLWRPLGRSGAEPKGKTRSCIDWDLPVLRVPVRAPADRPLRLAAFRID